jgi:hypothetical protein
MNPLQSRLGAVRRRLRRVILWRAGSLLIILLVGGALLAGVLDSHIHLPTLVRALVLVGILVGAGLVAYRTLFAPLRMSADDLALALRIEDKYPLLNDSLASTVEFLQQAPETRIGSAVLRREAVVRAMRLAQGCDFNQIVKTRGLRVASMAAMCLLAAVAFLFVSSPAWTWTAFVRLSDPFGEHDWPRQTRIALTFPERIAAGQPFAIRGEITGVIPEHAVIELDGMFTPQEIFKIVPDESGRTGKLSAPLDMSRQERDFGFRVRAGDAVEPRREGAWHRVHVAQPPRLASLNGLPSPQIDLRYPAYTDKAPQTLSPGVGRIEAVAGTVATIRGATDRPIHKVWVEHHPDIMATPGFGELPDNADARGERDFPVNLTAVFLGPLGPRHPVETLSLTAGGHAVWGRTHGALAADGRTFTIAFMPWMSGTYVLHLEDAEGLAKDYEYELQGLQPRGLADPVPVVNLEQPSSSQSVLPRADVVLQALADDEFFAVRLVYVEFRRKDKTGKWLDAVPHRVLLYDGPALEVTVAQVMSIFAACHAQAVPGVAAIIAALEGGVGMPSPHFAPSLHLRPRQVQVQRRWSLRGLVNEGDILILQACAHDFNDVSAFNFPGRSHEVELRVVGERALQAILDEAQHNVQQELIRLREWQEQALKKVIEAEQEWRATGKLGPETLDKLLEAEQVQKQVQARIGAREEEGLRAELERLKQMMTDNKLSPSGTQDRVQTLKSELDRLARERLPKIEQRLADAGKEQKDTASAKPPSPRTKGNLGKVRDDQEEVAQTLDELLKYLDTWATRNEIKAETRSIQQEQRELQQETEKLAEAVRQAPMRLADDQFKAALRKNAELQRRLGERTQRLLDKMDRVAQQRLDELDKQLQAGARTEDAKGKAHALLHQRQELKKQADALDKLVPTDEEKAGLARNLQSQKRIEERLKGLIERQDPATRDKAQKELITAEMLEKAKALAKSEMLPGEMANTGDLINPPENQRKQDSSFQQPEKEQPKREPQLGKALGQQSSSLKTLESMIDAMEERREEEVERLVKKQRDAQKDLNALMDQQERLQKKVQEAKDIQNVQERQEALQKLAEEQRRLEDEVAKKSRELSRLRAHQAGKALAKAGQKMGKAADHLDRGEDPDDAQKEALDRLEEAQEQLQEAENRLQEELAREQLARIADQLKGLKERQDAATAESERIHKSMLQDNRWGHAALRSLNDNAGVQKQIATETRGFKEKLKGAAAFELVVDRAARAMDDAARRMEKQAAAGPGRFEPFEKEELAAESKAYDAMLKRQREAGRRLENLLDALKPEDAVAQKPKKKSGDKKDQGPQGEQQGGIQAGDGIPPVAQLKLLRAEQQEVNDRTRDFAQEHAELSNLNREHQEELQAIHDDQERLFELFQSLSAAAKGGGDR